MKEHKCCPIDYCTCSILADEPNEDCPIHCSGPWPPRCGDCGRFLEKSANDNGK